MTVTVVAVHPSVVVVKTGSQQFEIPKSSFSTDPRPGQTWRLDLAHEPTEEEKIDGLNALLPRS